MIFVLLEKHSLPQLICKLNALNPFFEIAHYSSVTTYDFQFFKEIKISKICDCALKRLKLDILNFFELCKKWAAFFELFAVKQRF